MKIKAGSLRFQGGFTFIELLLVIIIIGMAAGVGIIMVVSGSAGTERRASAEILKQDLRKVYSLADNAARSGETTTDMRRDRYKIIFHSGTADPPNAYKIVKVTYAGDNNWTETDVVPSSREVNRIIEGTNWIKPSTNPNIWILLPGEVADYTLTCKPMGSIIEIEPLGEKKIEIETHDNGRRNAIYISDYGDLSESL